MINSSTKKVIRKCRYCGVSRSRKDMTKIPVNSEQLSAWIELLGPAFAGNIKNCKTNYICLNHIENEERGPYRLPKNVHSITLVNSKPKVRKPPKCKTDGYQTCRYCGISSPKREMTTVSSIPKQLSKWIEILGPEFADNIKKFKTSYICLDHIENEERGPFRLPKKVDNITLVNSKPKIKKTTITKMQKCRYCEISRPKRDMTRVPTLPQQLSKWIEILGPKFADNVKKFKYNLICLNHIENRERKLNRLPQRMDNTLKLTAEDDDNDDEAIEEEQTQKKKKEINGKRVESGRKITVNDYTSSEDELEEIDEKVIKEQNEEIEKKKKYKRSGRLANRKRMDYTFGIDEFEESGEEFFEEQKQKEMEEEGEFVQLEVPNHEMLMNSKKDGMETENSNPEMSSLVSRSEELNLDVTTDNNEEDVNQFNQEMEEEDQDCVEMVPPKPETIEMERVNHLNFIIVKSEMEEDNECIELESDVVNNPSNAKNVILSNENIQCRACGDHFNRILMTETPSDFEKRKEWIRILGPEFLENILKNSSPHFICIDDLRKMVT